MNGSIQLFTSVDHAVFLFCHTFQSSAPVELTEAETEYAVNAVKHIYDGHVVFQYNCTNTIPEQLLENVSDYFLKPPCPYSSLPLSSFFTFFVGTFLLPGQCYCWCVWSRGISWSCFKTFTITALWYTRTDFCGLWKARRHSCCWEILKHAEIHCEGGRLLPPLLWATLQDCTIFSFLN